ncbi:MAG: hypothetical protein IPO48_06345 [Saprospiraceae bacterium]|nr:hypothetical protein [Saprospiraceae bacterium]
MLKFSYSLNGGARINSRQFSSNLSVGSHTVLWTVTDRCDNTSTCTQTIQVRDTQKPTPYCLGTLTTVLMPSSGSVSIWAKDYDRGSSDNCSTNLKFSSSDVFPITLAQEGWAFTCADFPVGKDTIHRSLRMYVG